MTASPDPDLIRLLENLRYAVYNSTTDAIPSAELVLSRLKTSDSGNAQERFEVDARNLDNLHAAQVRNSEDERVCRAVLSQLQHFTEQRDVVSGAFRRHVDAFPEAVGPRTLLVQWQLRCGDIDGAVATIESLVDLAPTWIDDRLESAKHASLRFDQEAQDRLDEALLASGIGTAGIASKVRRAEVAGGFGDSAAAIRIVGRAARGGDLELVRVAIAVAENARESSARLYGTAARSFSMKGDVDAVTALCAASPFGPEDDGGEMLFALTCAYENSGRWLEAAGLHEKHKQLPRFQLAEAQNRRLNALLNADLVSDAVEVVSAAMRDGRSCFSMEIVQRTIRSAALTRPLLAADVLASWQGVRVTVRMLEEILAAVMVARGADVAVSWLLGHRTHFRVDEETWHTVLRLLLDNGESVCAWLGAAREQAESDQLRAVASLTAADDLSLLEIVFPRAGSLPPHVNQALVMHGLLRVAELPVDELDAWTAALAALPFERRSDEYADLVAAVADRFTVERQPARALEILEQLWDFGDDQVLIACPPSVIQSWVRALRWGRPDRWERDCGATIQRMIWVRRQLRVNQSQPPTPGREEALRLQHRATESVRAFVEAFAELNQVGRYSHIDRQVERLTSARIDPTPATLESLMVALPREARLGHLDRVRTLLGGQSMTAGLWTTFVVGGLSISRVESSESTPTTVRENVATCLARGEEVLLEAIAALRSAPGLSAVDANFSQGELLRIADSYPTSRYKAYGPLANDVRSRLRSCHTAHDGLVATLSAISAAHARYGLVAGVDRVHRAFDTIEHRASRDAQLDRLEAAGRAGSGPEVDLAAAGLGVDGMEWSSPDFLRLARVSGEFNTVEPRHVLTALGTADVNDDCRSVLAVELRRAQARRDGHAVSVLHRLAEHLGVIMPADLHPALFPSVPSHVTGIEDLCDPVSGERRADVLTAEQFRNFQGLVLHMMAVPGKNLNDALPVLRRAEESDDRARAALTLVRPSLEEAGQRIERLRRLLRIGERDDVSGTTLLEPVIDEVLASFRSTTDRLSIMVERDLEEGLTTEANAGLVAFLIENLVSNSVKQGDLLRSQGRTPEGGFRISVSTHFRAPQLGDDQRYGIVTIGVRDNGSGLPPNLMDDIRSWNYTSSPDHGLGIGLRSTAEGVDLAGGRLAALDQGGGAWVTIELPAGRALK
ncbi:ATP-binding protein [Nocardioides sp. Soil805]|uniref:ATP-binding protein n=1 Tax=Nocardioides sp. Soil805 TaxID=1736416 RepID=UPI000702F188|nr:ATP-binding protein [Nocardioides sp. Soil805]KRF37414.1 hypothetical protein ASG94_08815 [Nocardioides sp. Soil805]